MAKKKTTKASAKSSSFTEAVGINNLFNNERVNFIVGLFLLFVAGYMTWAFVSFFATGDADQSMIESPRAGELLNQNQEFQNACGSIGAYISWFFIKRCFGLSAFLIPVFILMVAVKLMRAYQVKLLKLFMCLTIIMVWVSVASAKFLAPLFDNSCFNPGGDHGLAVCQQIEGLTGTPGLTALLALTSIAFLTYLSMETIILIRKLFNPLHYMSKIPMTVSIGHGDTTTDGKTITTLEDPTVFDDPESETIDFPIEGEAPSTP
ncbi:MAG: DNA translocase FtsK 4TM domain-containing protein, partial [Prevotella sp.]|nr:DNA translocase FtsK 4TM domain-containing protein [Prevotella sp.]